MQFLQTSRSTFRNRAVSKLSVSSVTEGAVPAAIKIKSYLEKRSTKMNISVFVSKLSSSDDELEPKHSVSHSSSCTLF